MKINSTTPPEQFRPVTITLETKEEFLKFFALFNHTKLLREFLQPVFPENMIDLLRVHNNITYDDYIKDHQKLDALIR